MDYWTAKALLEWQVELGADEAILDAPLDRYGLTDPVPRSAAATSARAAGATPASAAAGTDPARPSLPPQQTVDPVAEAARAAALAGDLDGLRAALAAFEHCDLKKGARSLVFAEGDPAARVLIVTEPPDREDDLAGRPFAGRAGRLLDRMLEAIGLSRGAAAGQGGVYVLPVLPWRPPADRAPDAGELAMMRPFLERHIALAAPEVVVLMGNGPCQALLGRGGISGLRGRWAEVAGRPALPVFHPAALMRRPEAKRAAWADLLELDARLRAGATGEAPRATGAGGGAQTKGRAPGGGPGESGKDSPSGSTGPGGTGA